MIQLSDFYGYSMYTISSDTLSVSVMSLGATVTRLVYRGRNVVVSLKTPDDYLQDTSYLGAIVGRYANRIAGGRFPLNGKTVQVEQNEGRNHLHGGSVVPRMLSVPPRLKYMCVVGARMVPFVLTPSKSRNSRLPSTR